MKGNAADAPEVCWPAPQGGGGGARELRCRPQTPKGELGGVGVPVTCFGTFGLPG